MKQRSVWKKVLSVILSVAMVAGMITITEPQKVEAAERVVWSEDFNDGASSMVNHAGNASQSIMTDEADPYLKFGTSGWSAIKTPVISVESGKTYKLMYQLRMENVSGSMYYYNNLQEMNNGADTASVAYHDDAVKANTDGWVPVALDYTPAAGKNQVVFYFEDAGWGGTADIYLDDIKLVEIVEDKEPIDVELEFAGVQPLNPYMHASKVSTYRLSTKEISVEGGATYTLSYNMNLQATGSTHFELTALDLTNGNEVRSSDAKAVYSGGSSTDGWTMHHISFTFPSNTQKVQFMFTEWWGGSLEISMDDMTLTKSGETTPVYTNTFDSSADALIGSAVGGSVESISIVSEDAWNFDVTGTIEGVTAKYFVAEVMVDGTATSLHFEKAGNVLRIPESWFASIPSQTILIPAGTMIEEADPDEEWAAVPGGDRLNVAKELDLVNVDGEWKPVEKSDTVLSFNRVDKNSYLKMSGITGFQAYTPEIAVEEGQTYQITYRLNLSNKNGGVHFYPCMMELGATANYNADVSPAECKITAETGGWIDQSFSYTVPAGVTRIQIYFEQPWEGTADVCIDNLAVTKSGASEAVYSETFTTTASLPQNGTGTQNIEREEVWYLNGTNLANVSGQFFTADTKIDGKDVKIALEKSGDQFVIWTGWFGLIDATAAAPTERFVIAKDTVLYEANPSDWSQVTGGTQIAVSKEFELVKEEDGWVQVIQPEALYENELTFSKVENAHWYFDSTEALPANTDAAYFVATVTVDGSEKKIAFENLNSQMIVYDWFFTIGGGSYPTASVEIPAGTTLYEAQAISGWPTVEGGTQVKTTSDILVVKSGDSWVQKTAQEYDIELGFSSVDASSNWHFTADSYTTSDTYYKVGVSIDGTTYDVLIENTGGEFVVYDWFFTKFGGSLPTSSLEIPAGAVLKAVDSPNNWAEIENTDTYKVKNTLTVHKNNDTWEEYIAPEAVLETELGFVSNQNNQWTLSSTETLPSTSSAPFFAGIVVIDGTPTKVAIENTGSQLVIYPNFFTDVYGGSIPTSSFVIAAGTVLCEITTTGNWPEVNGGTQIKVTEELKVTKDGDTWLEYMEPEAVLETELDFVSNNSNQWTFSATETLPTTTNAEYFAATIVIDGESVKVPIANTGSQLVIYPNFFTDVYGGKVPTEELIIAAGTILYEITTTGNWPNVNGGTQIKVTEELKVTKEGNDWVQYIAPEAVLDMQLGFAGSANNEWHFSPSATLPTTSNAQYFSATIQIDGVDTKVAFENTGSQLVIYESFFTVYQGSVPKNNLKIPAGTVLYEMSPAGSWPNVAGGTQIKVTNDLLVEYFAEKWYDCDKVVDNTATPQGFVMDVNESMTLPAGDYTIYSVEENKSVTEINKAGTYDMRYVDVVVESNASDVLAAELENHTNLMLGTPEVKTDYWRFLIKEGSVSATATAGYYMLPVTIDGKLTTVTIEIEANGNFTIWSGFFSTLDSTAAMPSKSFKIAAGAVITPITAYNSTTVDASRTPIHVQNEITWSKQNVLTTDRIIAYKSYDVNGDGEINSVDLIALKKIETNHPDATDSISKRFCADINRDGAIDREDSLLLRDKFIVDWLAKTSDSSLVFASSDEQMSFFLNDFYMRHMGYEDENGTDYAVTTLKPGEDTTNTFYQEWMTKSLLWYNSKDGLNTDRYTGQKSIVESIPVDEYGYVWCGTDEVRPNAASEADGLHRMGWPFPTSADANTNGYATTWTFNAGERGKPTWTSNFGAANDTEQNMMVGTFTDQSSISYEVKMSAYADALTPYFAPWIELDLRMQLENPENVDDVYLYFITDANEAFSDAKCVSAKEWAALDYEFTEDYEHLLCFPMYAHSEWGENENPGNYFNQGVHKIYGLKIEIRAKSGKTITGSCGLNSVRSNFDTRHANNQGVFLTSLYEDFSLTGDVEYLERNLTKARKAMNFYLQMYDTERDLIRSSYLIGHDGDKTGIYSNSDWNWGEDHKQALIRASAIGNGYWDATYTPEYDFQTNLYFYKGLQSMIALEKYAEENGINISKSEATIKTAARNSGAIGSGAYNYTSADLQAIADRVLVALRADYNATTHTGFYNTATGRFIAGYDENAGKLYDYGYTQFNTEAIYLGVATDAQSESIMDWLDGTRTVSGERYTGSALYTYGFAPRSTTVANKSTSDTLFNGTIETDRVDNGKGADDEEEVQYGGAMLWTSFYDIMARMKVNGADDAYNRLKGIQSWYSGVYNYYTANAVENTYFYHDYYANNQVDGKWQLLQGGRYGTTATRGGNASGQMGIDSEMAESILLVSTIPYGFMGIEGSIGNTLNISPSLPSELTNLKLENLMFRDVKYDLTAMQDGVRLDAVHGKADGLQVTVSLAIEDGQSVYLNGKSTDSYSVSNGKAVITVPMRDTIIQVR